MNRGESEPEIDLARLTAVCIRVGSRIPLWNQGKGGNISVKRGNRLWIKASGVRLSQVSAPRGLASVDLDRFHLAVAAAPAAERESWYAQTLMECRLGEERPSMETGFHAQLPGIWVLHFHSLASIVMGHEFERRADVVARFLLRHADVSVEFVPAEIPGWRLSQRVVERSHADVIVLANHGVLLQGENPEALLTSWECIEQAFCRETGRAELTDFSSRLRPEDLRGAKFRAYFPDAAVFRDRIVAAATDPPTWPGGEPSDQQDALEMLEAIVLLGRACPELRELDAAASAEIAALPSESFRRS